MINKTLLQGAAVAAPNIARAGGCPPVVKLDVVHRLPGRLRLRSAALKGDRRASEEMRGQLARIAGVRSVTANPGTGSLLLQYDPAELPPREIVELLRPQGCILGAVDEVGAPEPGWAHGLASAVGDWVISALAERLALAMIGMLA
jgi:hypothetical protein